MLDVSSESLSESLPGETISHCSAEASGALSGDSLVEDGAERVGERECLWSDEARLFMAETISEAEEVEDGDGDAFPLSALTALSGEEEIGDANGDRAL